MTTTMKNKIKLSKKLKTILCVFLALCTGILGAIEIVGAVLAVEYLSDIKLFYVKNRTDNHIEVARKECEAAGYQLLAVDLNSGTGNRDYVFIGYKTTTNKDLAVTDIRLLGMNKDYYLYNYKEMLQYIKDSNTGIGYTMYNAANDFIVKYNAGSPKAADALKGLNLFNVGDQNTKFGDFILDGNADIDFFTEMIVKASTGTVNAVMNFLNMGIAPYELPETVEKPEVVVFNPDEGETAANETKPEDEEEDEEEADEEAEADNGDTADNLMQREAASVYTGEATNDTATQGDAETEATEPEETDPEETEPEAYDDDTQAGYIGVTWADALANSDLLKSMDDHLTRAEKNELHKLYNDDARDVFKQLQDFATLYENAAARNENGTAEAVENMEAEIKAENIKTEQDAVESMTDMDEEDSDAVYLSAYDTMNKYTTADGEPLGEWILNLGLQTSDEVDITQVYPIVEAMGTAQSGIVKAAGMLPAISNLGENESNQKMNEMLPKAIDAIKDYNKGDSISLWDNADDDIDDSYIAYTSDAVRVANANNSIGRRDKFDIIDEKLTNVLNWINTISSIVTVFVMVLKGALAIANVVTNVLYIVGAAVSATFSSFLAGAAAILSFASAALMWVGLAVMAFTIGWYLGKWIASLIKKADPTLKHTKFPDFVFDVADTPEGRYTVKYKCARDENNNVGDVNARQEEAWAALCFTTETQVGSPIRADENGDIFKVLYGNHNVQNGWDCVNMFGERNPANMNYLTSKDNAKGIYVSYRTEKSIANAAPVTTDETQTQTTTATNYISDIVVSVGGNANEAKAKITKKQGSYYIIDYNMSPNTDNYTYMAYSMTTDPKDAITDIRVAPYQGNGNINYGDVQYTFVGHVGLNVGPDSANTAGDAILKTKDEKAGSPIPADGLHFVSSHDEAEPGWEPVTLFCGVPYNFASFYLTDRNDTQGTSLSAFYQFSKFDLEDKSKCVEHSDVYLYYEPTVQYTSGEKYLAGIFFLQGFNDPDIRSKWMESEKVTYMDLAKAHIRKDPTATLLDRDLTADFRFQTLFDDLYQYIGYTYTYNPKRAICDITAFQGDTYNYTLPYNFGKPSYETGNVVNYAACSVISLNNRYEIQALVKATTKNHLFINPYNSIVNSRANLVSENDWDHSSLLLGYNKSLPLGFECSFSKLNFLPLGLYVAGATEGKQPLKLSDVIISENRHDGTEENSKVTFDVSGEKTLAGGNAEGAFRSVAEIKDPHSTQALDIAYPSFYNKYDKGKETPGNPTFIYIRDAGGNVRGKYISSVSVGSYSREQYRTELAGQKQHVEDKDVNSIDRSVNMNAMLSAACGGADEMLCMNLSVKQSEAWYNREDKDDKALWYAPENKPAAYIGVTRTDKKSEAITGLLLYQNDDTTTAKKIEIDNADYYCDSTSSPIIMNGKQYYLYYTRNIGVLSGMPVEEIMIDNVPIVNGYMTALCGKPGSTEPYGDPNLTYFIHLSAGEQTTAFLLDLYVGQGTDERAAVCDLVSQECSRYIPFNLNTDVSSTSVYLGYAMGALPLDATEEDREDAWYEAIYDIIVTKDEPYQPDGFICEKNNIYYAPVSDVNLNAGSPDADELYLYFCSPYLSSRYNRAQKKAKTGVVTALPEEVFSAPLSKVALAQYDRVPYLTKLEGTGNTENDITPWEYVMFASHKRPADFTSGSANFERSGNLADNRVTMFVQRCDGSVKPAAEITGGFIANSLEVGNLTARQEITKR